MFDLTGSYQSVWIFAILLSLVAALLCRPIDERQMGSVIANERVT